MANPPGPPRTLKNMRQQGVQHLLASASTTPVGIYIGEVRESSVIGRLRL